MVDTIAGVVIWTQNLKRMTDFYQDILRLKPFSQRADFVAFKFGDVRLSIGVHSEVKGKSADPYRIMVNLQTQDIHSDYQSLSRQGVQFIRLPEQEHWGGWVATFLDPDGNILQLLQQPIAQKSDE